MNKRIMLLIVILMVFVVESPVMAEIKGGEITISPFYGAFIYDGSQQLEPSFSAGLRLGYNLSKNWGVEGQFTYAALRNDGVYGGLYNFSGDLLYHFIPERKVVPYLLMGGGLSKTDYVVGSSSNGIFEYGAGLKYFITDDVAFRWDVRQIYSLNPNSGTSAGYWQNSAVNVGISYQFGGVEAVSPAVKEAAPTAVDVQQAEPVTKTVKEEPIQEELSSWQAENTIAPVGKILVTGMRVEKNEFEIIATEPIRDYKLFTLSQPSRLVVDIANGESGFILKKVIINRLGIATVRFESYPDYLRIFFDAAQGRLIPYRIEETAKGLKIIVTSP
jgi:outer membrane beta-barrel protein